MTEPMIDPLIVSQLAPTGVLRAAINMSNFLLVVDKDAEGNPVGTSPDVAAAIARRLGVPLKLVPYARPSEIADAAGNNEWDIANIGAEPQRAAVIDFTAAYAEIEATYLVPGDSPIEAIEEVDQPGNSISAPAGSAYGLWLENNISKAELRLIKGDAFAQFMDGDMSALGGLRSGLVKEVDKLPGARILDGQFTAVQQAVGVNKGRAEAFAWLLDFVEEIKASGFVADRIRHHGVEGQLSPAPSA